MQIAFGYLGWTPETFWSSTILELSNAYVGHCKRHGLGRWGESHLDVPALRAEMERIKELYPDGKISKRDKRELRRGGR